MWISIILLTLLQLHGLCIIPSKLDSLNIRSRPSFKFIFVYLLLFETSPFTTCFNIDWHYPIIIKATDEGTGFGGSGASTTPNYFGASLAFLKPEGGSYSWIIVGAPKANTPRSASSFPQHSDIPEPGVIWQCTLGRTPADVCRPVVMDPTGNVEQGVIHEWKNGSLLGGPNGIAVNSKTFVACASRLERWEEREKINTTLSYVHGSCYVRPRKDLLLVPNTADINVKRLNPLRDTSYEASNLNRHGQAGFSVHLPKSGIELVMSAPGLQRWMGSIIQYISRDGGDTYIKAAASKPFECSSSGQGCFHYLGYSLTSGLYYDRDAPPQVNNVASVYYAAGAPRGNNFKGKVIIFEFPNEQSGKEVALVVQQEIKGNQTGAYFGSSLLSVDLNADGYEDLVVGSPRFTREQRKMPRSGPVGRGFTPFQGYGDEGAVFVYFSSNRGKGALVRQSATLNGDNRPWSNFGTAMASLGDLNGDGYNDFAVSAPFEDTTGAVYIYHGNNVLIKNIPAQIIRGKQVDPGLRGFGFSLTGGEDIDNNGYNDLAVGSVNSSQIVVFRSKPIISVKGTIKSPLTMLPLDTETFMVFSCVSYTGNHAPSSIELKIHLEADAELPRRRVSIRREDASGFGNPPVVSLDYLQMLSKDGGEKCTKFYATVQEPLESSGAPVVFQQSITIPVEEPVVKSRFLHIQTRNGTFYTSGAKFIDFCQTCPLINTGQKGDGRLELPLAIPCGDDNVCHADLKLDVSFTGVDLTSGSFLVGSAASVTMEISLSNSNEPAIQPEVSVSWRKLKLKKNPTDCTKRLEQGSEITYVCKLGKLLGVGETAKVDLEFDLESLIVSERGGQMEMELLWNVIALTVSKQDHPATMSVSMPLSYQADPHIAGTRRMELFNVETVWKYLVFTQIFEIHLDGPSPVADIEAIFQLPVNLTTKEEQGKPPLVNVRGVDVFSDSGSESTLSCQATVGHFSKSSEALKPSQVEVDYMDPDFDAAGLGIKLPKEKEVNRGSNSTLIEKDRLLLHCNSPHVDCMEVTCKAAAVHFPGTKTEVKFIIDIAANDIRRLLKSLDVSAIQVESTGKLILSSVVKEIQPRSHKPDETTAVTLIEKEGYKPVSKWIFILAVVIGILVLLCFGCCLFACGCFEDKKPGYDVVDTAADDAGGTSEEMKPLKGSTNIVNEDTDQHHQVVPTSPFSDVVDPPEFIPTIPTIREEEEDEVTQSSGNGNNG